ncbi:MAG: DEAD/DEAH box helicase [Betaproteobacteria bacterium]|nr:DEAD/DEAH box helicase [Betaproteobacteria bacterium]
MNESSPAAIGGAQPSLSAETTGDTFQALGLHDALPRAVAAAGYTKPTPVQAATIPAALAGGDLMVASATGSGKTAAFVLPALNRLLTRPVKPMPGGGPRILVLCPTRELALQVARAAENYGRTCACVRLATVVGGVPYPAQLRAVRAPLDMLVATPGRLLDLLRGGRISLSRVEMLVLDEADRMLDMGFIEDIEAIAAATPFARQTLLFSATLGGDVARLAGNLLREPRRLEIASHQKRHADIEQRLHWADNRGHKDKMLYFLLRDVAIDQAIVFTATQIDAERLALRLAEEGHAVAALHGGMPQSQRNRTLNGLRRGQLRVLVATDVAARGIDVPTITHVFNYGLPLTAEEYVHRIGRTGRAGRSGLAVTFAEPDDVRKIRAIERFTTQRLPVAVIEGMEGRFKPEAQAPRGARPAGARRGGRPGDARTHRHEQPPRARRA